MAIFYKKTIKNSCKRRLSHKFSAQTQPGDQRSYDVLLLLTVRVGCHFLWHRSPLAGLLFRQIGAVPPAAAQSLKERGGVGIAIGLGLNEVDYGLVVGLFRAQ